MQSLISGTGRFREIWVPNFQASQQAGFKGKRKFIIIHAHSGQAGNSNNYALVLNFAVDDWRCDQNGWVHNGVTRLPRSSPLVKKYYFSIDTPEGSSNDFTRHAYILVDSDHKINFVGLSVCVCACVCVCGGGGGGGGRGRMKEDG